MMISRLLHSYKVRNAAKRFLLAKKRFGFKQPSRDLNSYKNILRLSLPDCPFYATLVGMNCRDLIKVKNGLISFKKNSQEYLLLRVGLLENLMHKDKLIHPIMQPAVLQALKEGVKVIFDLSGEGICYEQFVNEDTKNELIAFNNELEKLDFPPGSVYLLNANIKANEYINDFAEKNNITLRFTAIGYNFYLFYHWIEAKKFDFFHQHNQMLDVARETLVANKQRIKHFMCLNLKPRTHRTVLVANLTHNHCLVNGVVSYFGSGDKELNIEKDRTSYLSPNCMHYLMYVDDKQLINNAYNQLEKNVPLTYESDRQTVQNIFYRKKEALLRLIPEVKKYGEFKQIDTYFEIITETYFTNQKCLYLTEKTLRAILRFQFFIIVGSPYSLKYLRDIGFKTFSPFIDETYDEIEDEAERFACILEEVNRLCKLGKNEIHEMYRELWERILFNYNHFKNNVPTIFNNTLNTIVAKL